MLNSLTFQWRRHDRIFCLMCACSCTYVFHLLFMCYTALHKHVLSFRESGYIYGNIFKFSNNSRAWFAFCNIYVIYMLMKMHVISQADAIMLPVLWLCPYWQMWLFSDGVCKRPFTIQGSCLGYTVTMMCAPDSLVEVVLEGTSSRTVCSWSLCSGGFGGHPCWEACASGPIWETRVIQIYDR